MGLELKETQYKSFYQVLIVSCAVSLGALTYSYQMHSMNDVLETLIIIFEVSPKWQSLVEGLLTTSVFIGAFIGAISCSYLVKFSLRSVIITLDVLLITGSIFQASTNPYIFMLGRLISGMGSGMHSIVVPVFLKQITPKELFGIMVGVCQMTYAIGYMLTETLGLILKLPKNPTISDIDFNILKIYFLDPSIFSLIRILLFMTFVRSESPFYYIQQNNSTKAEEYIIKIYKKEYVEAILDNLHQQRDKIEQKVDIFSDALKIRLRLALSINSLYALCGVSTVTQYSTKIFNKITPPETALLLTLLISVLKVICYSTSAIVSQKVGRRKPFLFGNSIMCLSLAGIAVSALLEQQMVLPKETQQHLLYLTLILVLIFIEVAAYNSICFLASVYLPEIVPGQGVAMAFQLFWFLNIVTLFGFPVVKQYAGISVCFFFFGFCTLCEQGILNKFALETANKNETEIDKMFDKFRFSTRKSTQIQESLINNIDEESVVDNNVLKSKRDNVLKSTNDDE